MIYFIKKIGKKTAPLCVHASARWKMGFWEFATGPKLPIITVKPMSSNESYSQTWPI
jgi:hypothetical protein